MERTTLLKRRKTKMEDNIFLFIPNLIGKASIASPHIELVGCSLAGQPYFFLVTGRRKKTAGSQTRLGVREGDNIGYEQWNLSIMVTHGTSIFIHCGQVSALARSRHIGFKGWSL